MQRKTTFRLYPNATETKALEEAHALHCRVTNALIEEHKRRHEAGEEAYNFSAMCKDITRWRGYSKALDGLNAQSLQVTAKRVALAFDAFFRRLKSGEAPGYPRFKSHVRFSGWGYKAHGDGWKLMQAKSMANSRGCAGHAYGAVRLSGAGTISMRGRARFDGEPKTAEVFRKGDKWYLSVTFDVTEKSVARKGGSESMAFDWGLSTLLTQVVGDPMTGVVDTVENPRWLKRQMQRIVALQRDISAMEELAKRQSGKQSRFPVDARLKRACARLRAIHGKIARQRNDFYHQLTARMVERFGLIVTEELSVKNMSRAPAPKPDPDNPGKFLPNGAAAKAGLNRSILDAAPAGLIAKLRCKAEEAGTKFLTTPTRKLKPTQRCHVCGKTTRLELKDRQWTCACGARHDRDENSARTNLRYAFEGAWWTEKRPGTGQVVREHH